MGLEAQCDRCQGYFRNFSQIVRKADKAFCVQCDQAIKAGASESMYSHELPQNCVFDGEVRGYTNGQEGAVA
ncbi:hypothetical protein [Schauerella aestuarii]|uniref:hypothetical protein n=1 Tax=Schauerella aestuarii TaxID=2511204 RepID=UPI001370A324|nr:hypothetical protein [Achromobacter aestuarii]MYZ41406.1 hypothetical protein [Achromobacter aestuarii]